ncbi:MAG: hypothetical protein WCT33_04530 [Patescibacteria group bacterium]
MKQQIHLVFGTMLVKRGNWIGYAPDTILAAFPDEEQAKLFLQPFGWHIAQIRQFDSAEEAIEMIRAEQTQLQKELEQRERNRS